jgi:hypothetical protein
MQRKRNPAAVRVLEELQQQERESRGEPPITREAVIENLRQDFLQKALQRMSPAEMIEGVTAAIPMVEKQLAELLERTDVADPEQWSRYEQPLARVHIARICEQIETAFERRGWVLPELPVVGTLATGQIGAQVQPAADDTALVLIDNAFFKFAGVMSQLCLFSGLDGGRANEATLQILADLVSTHAFLGSCFYMSSRTTPQDLTGIVNLLQHAVVVFVIAHEYAHFAAGDLCAIGDDGGENAPLDLRARELEADRKAALIVVEVTDAEGREQGLSDSGFGIMAPFIFLAGLDILSRAEDAVAGVTPVTESSSPQERPTTYERVAALQKLCGSDPDLQPVIHQAETASGTCLQLIRLYQRIHHLVIAVREELGLPDPRELGTPTSPGYPVPKVIWYFWDRVWAEFTGSAPGDMIRSRIGAMSGLMRERGADVSDLESIMNAKCGAASRSESE